MAERNPNWTRDELILALEFYKRYSGNPPSKTSEEIRELSDTLNRMAHEQFKVTSDFRNPNGVYMKIMNFRSFDPAYISQGLKGLANGGKLDEEVWNDFADDLDRLKKTANAIRSFIASPKMLREDEAEDDETSEGREGRVLSRVHTYKERDRKIIAKKKASVLKTQGRLACECCSFDFEKAYGDRGNGFIEVHHIKPIFELEPDTATKLEDLALLCANCHRMIHAKKPWLSVAELKSALKAVKK
jgi:5-methylcytosine-specific restriction protein A